MATIQRVGNSDEIQIVTNNNETIKIKYIETGVGIERGFRFTSRGGVDRNDAYQIIAENLEAYQQAIQPIIEERIQQADGNIFGSGTADNAVTKGNLEEVRDGLHYMDNVLNAAAIPGFYQAVDALGTQTRTVTGGRAGQRTIVADGNVDPTVKQDFLTAHKDADITAAETTLLAAGWKPDLDIQITVDPDTLEINVTSDRPPLDDAHATAEFDEQTDALRTQLETAIDTALKGDDNLILQSEYDAIKLLVDANVAAASSGSQLDQLINNLASDVLNAKAADIAPALSGTLQYAEGQPVNISIDWNRDFAEDEAQTYITENADALKTELTTLITERMQGDDSVILTAEKDSFLTGLETEIAAVAGLDAANIDKPYLTSLYDLAREVADGIDALAPLSADIALDNDADIRFSLNFNRDPLDGEAQAYITENADALKTELGLVIKQLMLDEGDDLFVDASEKQAFMDKLDTELAHIDGLADADKGYSPALYALVKDVAEGVEAIEPAAVTPETATSPRIVAQNEVSEVQGLLVLLESSHDLTVDGIMGPETQAAIDQYIAETDGLEAGASLQEVHTLLVDKLNTDPALRATIKSHMDEIMADEGHEPGSPTPKDHTHSPDNHVKALQAVVNIGQADADKITIDGLPGRRDRTESDTMKAYKRFTADEVSIDLGNTVPDADLTSSDRLVNPEALEDAQAAIEAWKEKHPGKDIPAEGIIGIFDNRGFDANKTPMLIRMHGDDVVMHQIHRDNADTLLVNGYSVDPRILDKAASILERDINDRDIEVGGIHFHTKYLGNNQASFNTRDISFESRDKDHVTTHIHDAKGASVLFETEDLKEAADKLDSSGALKSLFNDVDRSQRRIWAANVGNLKEHLKDARKDPNAGGLSVTFEESRHGSLAVISAANGEVARIPERLYEEILERTAAQRDGHTLNLNAGLSAPGV